MRGRPPKEVTRDVTFKIRLTAEEAEILTNLSERTIGSVSESHRSLLRYLKRRRTMTIYILQGEELDETGENGITYIYGIFDNQELAKKKEQELKVALHLSGSKEKVSVEPILMNRTNDLFDMAMESYYDALKV